MKRAVFNFFRGHDNPVTVKELPNSSRGEMKSLVNARIQGGDLRFDAKLAEVTQDGDLTASEYEGVRRGRVGTLDLKSLKLARAGTEVASAVAVEIAALRKTQIREMEAGKVFSGTAVKGGHVHQLTEAVIPASRGDMMENGFRVWNWALDQKGYVEGQRYVTGMDDEGQVTAQNEYMRLATMASSVSDRLVDHMSIMKTTRITYEGDRWIIEWQSFPEGSENGTTKVDDGRIELIDHKGPEGQAMTLVRMESKHRIDPLGAGLETIERIPFMGKVVHSLVATGMRDTFRGSCVNYQNIGLAMRAPLGSDLPHPEVGQLTDMRVEDGELRFEVQTRPIGE